MSCQKCDQAQQMIPIPAATRELDPTEEDDGAMLEMELAPRQHTFVRVGPANVQLSGCREHLEQFMGKPLVLLKPQDGSPEL